MKRITALFLTIILALSFAGCSSQKNIEGTLPEIMEKVLTGADVDAEIHDWLLSGLSYTELDSSLSESFLGASYDFKEGYSAEPLMNAQAFSVVLVRADSAASAKTLATEIKKTANPNKWICVGVDENNVITASSGDLAILVMADNAQKYIDAFNSL